MSPTVKLSYTRKRGALAGDVSLLDEIGGGVEEIKSATASCRSASTTRFGFMARTSKMASQLRRRTEPLQILAKLLMTAVIPYCRRRADQRPRCEYLRLLEEALLNFSG